MLENDKAMKNAKTKQLKEAISRDLKLSRFFFLKGGKKFILNSLSEQDNAWCWIYIALEQGGTGLSGW